MLTICQNKNRMRRSGMDTPLLSYVFKDMDILESEYFLDFLMICRDMQSD